MADMQYPQLIALIDAELARLGAARSILTSTSSGVEAPAGRSVPRQPKSRLPLPSSPEPEIVAVAARPAVVRKEARSRRQALRGRAPRAAQANRKAAGEASALGGSVPTGPVFVSAEQMRLRRAAKQESQSNGEATRSTAPREPLTAEVLMQRWLHPARVSAS